MSATMASISSNMMKKAVPFPKPNSLLTRPPPPTMFPIKSLIPTNLLLVHNQYNIPPEIPGKTNSTPEEFPTSPAHNPVPSIPPEVPEIPQAPEIETTPPEIITPEIPEVPNPGPEIPVPPNPSPTPPDIPLPPPGTPMPRPPPDELPPGSPPGPDILPPLDLPPDIKPPPGPGYI